MAKFTSGVSSLEKLIEEFRSIADYGIKSEDLSEADLEMLNIGFTQGLCVASTITAQEIDEYKGVNPDNKDSRTSEEMDWWNSREDFGIENYEE